MRYPREFAAGIAWVYAHASLSIPEISARFALPPSTARPLLERGDARAHARRGDIPTTVLEELPAHRVSPLLARLDRALDRHRELLRPDQSTSQQIARCSLLPCNVPRRAEPSSRACVHATEGEDGLYHLCHDGRALACHREGTHPAPNRLRRSRLSVPATLVPENLRCEPADPLWGPGSDSHTHRAPRMIRIVDQLRAVQGLSCAACHKRLAQLVDHDHETGLVRGLLCSGCNINVDSCTHSAGCPFAEYLNAPPAPAGLRYPRHKPSASPRARSGTN